MLSSFCQRAEGFSTFVTFSWWQRGCEFLWIFCSCRLKFLGELKTFEQVEQMTGVCFPIELGIVGSRLSVQERRILFKKFFKFYQS